MCHLCCKAYLLIPPNLHICRIAQYYSVCPAESLLSSYWGVF